MTSCSFRTTLIFLLLCVSFVLRGAEIGATTTSVTVTAKPQWTETPIFLNVGDTLSITASGLWRHDTCCGSLYGPDGDPLTPTNANGFMTQIPLGKLIGAIAPTGNNDDYFKSLGQNHPDFFEVGSSLTFFQAPTSGKLYLGFNDYALPGNPPATNDNTGSVTATVTTPAAPPPPVVLVHGWCGSAKSFGQMKTLLETDLGLPPEGVVAFDYSKNGIVPDPEDRKDLERLATELAQFIKTQMSLHGAAQVDVVAHSMGGLITRAWMSGIIALNEPYNDEIRRFVLAGTPNFGVSGVARLRGSFCQGTEINEVAKAQKPQMFHGSHFLKLLNEIWELEVGADNISPEDVMAIVGCGVDPPNNPCLGDEFLNIPIVRESSATLPLPSDGPDYLVRYVDRDHRSPPLRPGEGIVDINDRGHPTYRLVKQFLETGTADPVFEPQVLYGLISIPLIQPSGMSFTKTAGVKFVVTDCATGEKTTFATKTPVDPDGRRGPEEASGLWTLLNVAGGCWKVEVNSGTLVSVEPLEVDVIVGRPTISPPLVVCRRGEPCLPPPPPPPPCPCE